MTIKTAYSEAGIPLLQYLINNAIKYKYSPKSVKKDWEKMTGKKWESIQFYIDFLNKVKDA